MRDNISIGGSARAPLSLRPCTIRLFNK